MMFLVKELAMICSINATFVLIIFLVFCIVFLFCLSFCCVLFPMLYVSLAFASGFKLWGSCCIFCPNMYLKVL